MNIYLTHRDSYVLERHVRRYVCVRKKRWHQVHIKPREWNFALRCECSPLPPILGKPENPLLEMKEAKEQS